MFFSMLPAPESDDRIHAGDEVLRQRLVLKLLGNVHNRVPGASCRSLVTHGIGFYARTWTTMRDADHVSSPRSGHSVIGRTPVFAMLHGIAPARGNGEDAVWQEFLERRRRTFR